MPNESKYGKRSSSEQDTQWLRHDYWIRPARHWIWPPRILNSLPNGITRVSRDNYHEMIMEISQWRRSLPKDFPWRSRGLPGAIPYQATDWDAYQMAYQRIKKLSPNGILNWMPNHITRGLPNAYRDGHREKRATDTLLNAESRDAGIHISKAAFREQMCANSGVSMTTQCEALVLDLDQWYTAHAWCNWRILLPSNGHHRVTYENRRLWRCQERNSHHCPKSRQGAVANDVEIERIATPHLTVTQQAEQVTMRHSHCNDLKIECIGTSHTTVSQQAEHVRIDTGQRATQKDDRSRRKIVCWRSPSRSQLHIKSPMNPNINSEIQVTLLPSHDANRQWIWWRSCRRSN